jgi:hypothetical protein
MLGFKGLDYAAIAIAVLHSRQARGTFFTSLQILTKSKLFLTEQMVIVRYLSQRNQNDSWLQLRSDEADTRRK